MKTKELDGLERLAKAATPGPWWVYHPENGDDAYVAYGVEGDGSQTYDLIDAYDVDTDYEYIAAVDPQTVLTLIAAARERDAMREAIETAYGELYQLSVNDGNAVLLEGIVVAREVLKVARSPSPAPR